MDRKKPISRKRPIKIEIETDLPRPASYSSDETSKQSSLKESIIKSDEEIESSRACSSNYFQNDQIKTSFESFVIEDSKDEEDSKLGLDRLEKFAKKKKWEPANWKEQFDLIRQMRGESSAPVDTMGCDAIASIDSTLSPQERRYQVLVSLMLSSQTKDEVTAQAMSKLQKIPLNIENFLAASNEELEKMIYPVSFYKRKVVYIKKTSQILKEKYNSDIPQTVEELQKLPGVGPKMAYLTMTCAWNDTVGIGVDTHVHRISNRLGWLQTVTKIPEQTRKQLEEWLPQTHWEEVNHLLVGFGQTICRPVGPHCTDCLCKQLCPHGQKVILAKSTSNKKKSNTKSSKSN